MTDIYIQYDASGVDNSLKNRLAVFKKIHYLCDRKLNVQAYEDLMDTVG